MDLTKESMNIIH